MTGGEHTNTSGGCQRYLPLLQNMHSQTQMDTHNMNRMYSGLSRSWYTDTHSLLRENAIWAITVQSSGSSFAFTQQLCGKEFKEMLHLFMCHCQWEVLSLPCCSMKLNEVIDSIWCTSSRNVVPCARCKWKHIRRDCSELSFDCRVSPFICQSDGLSIWALAPISFAARCWKLQESAACAHLYVWVKQLISFVCLTKEIMNIHPEEASGTQTFLPVVGNRSEHSVSHH